MVRARGGWRGSAVLTLLSFASCLDTSVPPRRELKPGSLRATLVTVRSGSAAQVPAAGATIQLLGSTLATRADDEGNFRLGELTALAGRVLIEFPGTDPSERRSRIISLEAVGAGFGRDVNLGTLVLGRPAAVIGVARREDVATAGGHGGIAVFTPLERPITFTSDDGSFVLAGVPEGDSTVAASAPGYENTSLEVTASGGQELRLAPFTLRRTSALSVATLVGRVVSNTGEALDGVTVRMVRGVGEVTTTSNAEGSFTFTEQPVGLTFLALEKAGFAPLLVRNVVIDAPRTTVGP
ncbi:MAG: carboxypeptidase regulatory-like domain-containing protein, partial [Myxococcaceae bacterium]|nr:carboxypeptidase regulatory-like domain-containing protein [Myxococcaceae bacterium]